MNHQTNPAFTSHMKAVYNSVA